MSAVPTGGTDKLFTNATASTGQPTPIGQNKNAQGTAFRLSPAALATLKKSQLPKTDESHGIQKGVKINLQDTRRQELKLKGWDPHCTKEQAQKMLPGQWVIRREGKQFTLSVQTGEPKNPKLDETRITYETDSDSPNKLLYTIGGLSDPVTLSDLLDELVPTYLTDGLMIENATPMGAAPTPKQVSQYGQVPPRANIDDLHMSQPETPRSSPSSPRSQYDSADSALRGFEDELQASPPPSQGTVATKAASTPLAPKKQHKFQLPPPPSSAKDREPVVTKSPRNLQYAQLPNETHQTESAPATLGEAVARGRGGLKSTQAAGRAPVVLSEVFQFESIQEARKEIAKAKDNNEYILWQESGNKKEIRLLTRGGVAKVYTNKTLEQIALECEKEGFKPYSSAK